MIYRILGAKFSLESGRRRVQNSLQRSLTGNRPRKMEVTPLNIRHLFAVLVIFFRRVGYLGLQAFSLR
jgi:hypothetical protein